jgi:hypothetical protein
MDVGKYIVLIQIDMCLTAHSYITSLGYILQQFNNRQQPSMPEPRPRLDWLGVEKPGDHRHPAVELYVMTFMQDCSPFGI